MENRNLALIEMRPVIKTAKISEQMSPAEKFQNQTLRPVIKLQHELLLAVFSDYITKCKNIFHTLTLEKRMDYIENALQKDTKLRNSLKGMIIGQFTLQEYNMYSKDASALSKRIMSLIKERLQDSIQLFELI